MTSDKQAAANAMRFRTLLSGILPAVFLRKVYARIRRWLYWKSIFIDFRSIRNRNILWAARRGLSRVDNSLPIVLPLKPKALRGTEIYCRLGTTDIEVFEDTFIKRYHLPPLDLEPVRTILDLGSNIGLTIAHFASVF